MPGNALVEAEIQQQIDELRKQVAALTTDLSTSLKVIAELLSDDGGIAISLKNLNDQIRTLRAEVHTTDDALGDSQTIKTLGLSLQEIRSKLGAP
jgi:chromosome segregation ATPase